MPLVDKFYGLEMKRNWQDIDSMMNVRKTIYLYHIKMIQRVHYEASQTKQNKQKCEKSLWKHLGECKVSRGEHQQLSTIQPHIPWALCHDKANQTIRFKLTI